MFLTFLFFHIAREEYRIFVEPLYLIELFAIKSYCCSFHQLFIYFRHLLDENSFHKKINYEVNQSFAPPVFNVPEYVLISEYMYFSIVILRLIRLLNTKPKSVVQTQLQFSIKSVTLSVSRRR